MALVLKDRVKQDTTTAGTGTITLSGTYLGYQSFSAIGNGNTTYYCIAGQGTNEWEVGIGTYTAAGTTLSRDTILASSNAGSAVPFSAGTKDVFVVYPAGKSVYQDASGNVGIGTTSAGSRLDVNGAVTARGDASSVGLYLTTGAGAIRYTFAADSYFDYSTGGTTGSLILRRGSSFSTTAIFDSSGNVGIGTSSVASGYRLEVFGSGVRNTADTTYFDMYSSIQPTDYKWWRTGNSNAEYHITAINDAGNASDTALKITRNGSLIDSVIFGTYAAERMRINNAGNVGIGTNTPANRLDIVNTSTSAQMTVTGTDGLYAGIFGGEGTAPGIFFSNAAPALRFGTGTAKSLGTFTERMRLTAAGNLGIGTTSPGVRLDVVKASNGRAWAASADDIFSIENNGTANIDLRATDATGSYIMFSDTTNRATGWIQYDHSTNFMAFRVNAGERIRIDNGGNVGIGTASPNGKLDVSGGYSVLNGLRISGADTTNTIYQATGALALSTGSASGITFATNLVTRYSIDSTGVSVWSVGGSERMRLDASGNLGIGTDSPGALLHLNSAAGGGDVPRIRFTNGGTGTGATDGAFVGVSNTSQLDVWNFENDAVRFGTNNAERMRLTAAGNLGVGTATPATLLHVQSTNYPRIRVKRDGGFGYTDVISQYGDSGYFGLTSASGDYSIFLGNAVTAVAIGADRAVPLIFGTNNLERMRLDASGNLGLGVTPSAWSGGFVAMQYPGGSIASYASGTNLQIEVGNAYYQSSLGIYAYFNSGTAPTLYRQLAGEHRWLTAPSGTAGNAISFTQSMTLDSSGNLGVGTSSPSAKVHSYIASGANALLLESSANFGVYARWKRPNREYYLALDINNNGGNDFTLYDATAAAHRWTVDSSGNLGLGVTPSAWSGAVGRVLQIANVTGTFLYGGGGQSILGTNAYYDTSWKYAGTGNATYYEQSIGSHIWFTAPSGTAGTAIGFTQAMTLNASGNLGVGTASPAERLDVFGQAQIRPVTNINGSTDWFAIGSILEASNFGVGVGIFVEDAVSNKYAMTFGTKPNSATAITERMRLDSSGNLGIGNSNPQQPLHVTGNGLFDGAAQGNIIIQKTGTNGFSLFSSAAGTLGFYDVNASAERMRLDSSGNMLLGGTATPASATASLAIFNGTAPTGSVTNGIVLYAEDVSSSSELKVRDEAGNVTTLSPHNFSLIPDGPSEDMAWAYYSEKGGKRINVDMLKLARMVEKLTGEKLVYEN